MKFLSILFLLVFNLLGAEVISASQKPKSDLESISKHAIVFGTGNASDVYVFVDPLCKYSRELIKKIDDNKMLQLSNRYYIFLYRLPRLDSEKTMQYILESTDPKATLIEIMIEEDILELVDFKAKESTIKALREIADVASTLDMTQRPYMISFDKDSKYCRVSEGTASCLEELE
ncbi:MAG: hypothetical protein A2W82_09775 [Sulfurimonas sp. RIFCSPLOWO2_12_36_12]|uniref:hypothetical protein n=1 Tax=Sulfurimonas sp. RIFCSPLOWO2_12_36_12 TaxID=1802253 RepID=UPI0008C7BB23|nr:hypothetical protein [Sulfurimonas sp. RIFCSPLOWO2_12_36_12]OHE02375.1 MAG: hypothetical protein A2W82_09775 [Sulfurimonas sp. RIFCSPLOWO2_12_36_12]